MTTPHARIGGTEFVRDGKWIRVEDHPPVWYEVPVEVASAVTRALAQARAEERERTLDEVLKYIQARIDGWASGGEAFGISTHVIHSRGEARAIFDSIAALRAG